MMNSVALFSFFLVLLLVTQHFCTAHSPATTAIDDDDSQQTTGQKRGALAFEIGTLQDIVEGAEKKWRGGLLSLKERFKWVEAKGAANTPLMPDEVSELDRKGRADLKRSIDALAEVKAVLKRARGALLGELNTAEMAVADSDFHRRVLAKWLAEWDEKLLKFQSDLVEGETMWGKFIAAIKQKARLENKMADMESSREQQIQKMQAGHSAILKRIDTVQQKLQAGVSMNASEIAGIEADGEMGMALVRSSYEEIKAGMGVSEEAAMAAFSGEGGGEGSDVTSGEGVTKEKALGMFKWSVEKLEADWKKFVDMLKLQAEADALFEEVETSFEESTVEKASSNRAAEQRQRHGEEL